MNFEIDFKIEKFKYVYFKRFKFFFNFLKKHNLKLEIKNLFSLKFLI